MKNCRKNNIAASRIASATLGFRRRDGFTLIELLVVIVIIMILVGVIIGAAKYARTSAARRRAQSEIAAIENALESYKNDNGIYPRSTITRLDAVHNCTNLYAALVAGPNNPKTYFTFKPNQIRQVTGTSTNIIDPFGFPYNYFNPPPGGSDTATNSTTFDLWSYGPDNQNDTADDIVNWRQ
jgi:general secretion pathway protein G